MEFVWGRYSGLFYTGVGALLFIAVGILFGSFGRGSYFGHSEVPLLVPPSSRVVR
mgnify:CR=1 FL=1